MPIELHLIAYAAVLLLFNILAAGQVKTKQYGKAWNMGARDEALPPLNVIAARLARAQANLLETLPIAVIALIGVVVAGRTSEYTTIGGWTWLVARVVYLPLYWAGVPKWRSIAYLVSLAGLGMVIWPLLRP